ncbi:MAG: DUF1501 domain-containing protein [Planctomycetes bacterium]|nr:DUF1501 domain-containing protein [Planctomycetota bacterium]
MSVEFPMSRRELLSRYGSGVGMLGLAAVLGQQALGSESTVNPLAEKAARFAPRAKRVIHLWMNGAPSQVDTFDPKPALEKYAGQRPENTAKLKTEFETGGLLPSPFKFQRHGQSGLEISELFPHLSRCADDLCVIRSMHTDVPVHESSNWMMFTGSIQPVRPSYGSWLLYGLGTENQNLPGFVVLGEGQPVNGPSNWSSRFLPGIYQGCQIALPRTFNPGEVIPHLQNRQLSSTSQRRELDFIQRLNALYSERQGAENAFNARIESLELAFRMQTSAEEAFDISRETESTLDQYGLTGPEASLVATVPGQSTVDRTIFGRNCLLARRLVERGVRVVQVYCGRAQPWDTHSKNSQGHRDLCQVVDRPIAGLLQDLKQRGLLDETLILWGGEFGRTPTSQGNDGRDHNHYGFTVWLAGGGVKGGLVHGATDEFGFNAIEKRMHVHDLHATMLHLMGIDHEQLTFRYSGRDFRLTDVHGNVAHEIVA